MILRSKIMKNTSVSKAYTAAAGGKNLLHNPKATYATESIGAAIRLKNHGVEYE
jgi:hypothetical protein